MPWLSDGNYYVFKEEAIKAKAPPISGVYGLYNRKRYVLIGETSDIRGALLHHEKETGFRFGLYRPAGFTFEVWSADLRAQRAQELIAEFHPVLQPRRLFPFVRSRTASTDETVSGAAARTAKQPEDPPKPTAANQKTKDRRSYISGDQLLVVALAFVVTAVSIGFLGILTEKKIEPKRMVKNEETLAKIPVDRPGEALGSAQGAQVKDGLFSSDSLTYEPGLQPAGEEPNEGTKKQQKTAKTEIARSKSVVEETATDTKQKASDTVASLAAVRKESQISQTAQREGAVTRWTVQVKASPDKSLAGFWADELKMKGYDVSIVETVIKGQTWYRVRVGHFDNHQDAETMRRILDIKEGISDAFVAANKVPKSQKN